MQYIPFSNSFRTESETKRKVSDAAIQLYARLKKCRLNALNISDYNKRYLKDYIDHYTFYIFIYSQLLLNAIGELKRPIEECTLVDYGGGCGLLSFLAKEAGFKTIIYNDIYEVSVNDVPVISAALGVGVDHLVHGDAEELVTYLNKNQLHPDLICSMDVLEHIYSPGNWMKTISALNHNFSIVFMTSANGNNPFIKRRLKKIQIRDEYVGNQKEWGWKERDITMPFFKVRKRIIRSYAPGLESDIVELLAGKTRGLVKEDIEERLRDYLENGRTPDSLPHPTNTCDPYTGNWSENILSPKYLKQMVQASGMEFVIRNSYYGYSDKRHINVLKGMINFLIRMAPRNSLIMSPAYILIARKADFPN